MILIQIDNKLYVSETRKPKHEDYKLEIVYDTDIAIWELHLIPVKEGEESTKFINYALSLGNYLYITACTDKMKKEGIEIPDDCFTTKVMGKGKQYAFLKPKFYLIAQPKKEVSNEAFYWQKVIEKRIEHFNNNYHTHEANELQFALNTIKRLVPPISFKI